MVTAPPKPTDATMRQRLQADIDAALAGGLPPTICSIS